MSHHTLAGVLFMLAVLLKGIAMPSASAKAKAEDNFYRRAQLEALLREEFPDLTVLEAEDGTVFKIDNPAAMSDDTLEAVEAAGEHPVRIARAYLDSHMGEGTYDGPYKEAGGQATFVMFALRQEQERQQATTPGAGTPTR